jgi:hypothetical protein
MKAACPVVATQNQARPDRRNQSPSLEGFSSLVIVMRLLPWFVVDDPGHAVFVESHLADLEIGYGFWMHAPKRAKCERETGAS